MSDLDICEASNSQSSLTQRGQLLGNSPSIYKNVRFFSFFPCSFLFLFCLSSLYKFHRNILFLVIQICSFEFLSPSYHKQSIPSEWLWAQGPTSSAAVSSSMVRVHICFDYGQGEGSPQPKHKPTSIPVCFQ